MLVRVELNSRPRDFQGTAFLKTEWPTGLDTQRPQSHNVRGYDSHLILQCPQSHNVRGYDSHLILQCAGKLNNSEEYGGKVHCLLDRHLDFLDLLQYMNASLEELVVNLAKEEDGKFHELKRFIEKSKVPLLLRKGVYSYDYVDEH